MSLSGTYREADDELKEIIKDLKDGKAGATERLYKYVANEKEKGVLYCDSFFKSLGVVPPTK